VLGLKPAKMPDDKAGDGTYREVPGFADLGFPAIPPVQIPSGDKLLQFSFRHLDLGNERFPLINCPVEFFQRLMERIKTFSNWTVEAFQDQNNNEHRHTIDFRETSEPDGVKSVVDPDQFDYHEAWQFDLCKTELWRVHGILVDDTFFVIWLDPQHRLYPITAPS